MVVLHDQSYIVHVWHNMCIYCMASQNHSKSIWNGKHAGLQAASTNHGVPTAWPKVVMVQKHWTYCNIARGLWAISDVSKSGIYEVEFKQWYRWYLAILLPWINSNLMFQRWSEQQCGWTASMIGWMVVGVVGGCLASWVACCMGDPSQYSFARQVIPSYCWVPLWLTPSAACPRLS